MRNPRHANHAPDRCRRRLALLLTALYELTDNLLAPIVAHALFNALNFITLFFVEHA